MRASNENLIRLNIIFITALIVSNVVASKVVEVGAFLIPAAGICYGVTFLSTDIISELWGKKEANRTVRRGLMAQLIALALIQLAIALKPAPFAVEYSEVFRSVLGASTRVTVAGLIAYLTSQTNDVFIFHFLKKKTQGKKKWLRNNLSTMTSQVIDTAIFITIAFYGEVPSVLELIIGQYIVKLIIAILDTPIFYLLTKCSKDK